MCTWEQSRARLLERRAVLVVQAALVVLKTQERQARTTSRSMEYRLLDLSIE
jgi:hypothetical protein